MKKLIIASNNQKKIKEIKEILTGISLTILSLKDENIDIDVVEDGKTFEENAKKKAVEICDYLLKRGESNFIVLGDDSGLEVDYLNGEPGIYSARYSGSHGDNEKNNEKLLERLSGVKREDRKARFVCQLALVDDKKRYKAITGYVEGYILEALNGAGGFGYDPLFYYEPLKKSFGEATAEEKNEISHRGIALKKFKEEIKGFL
ncbi:XTP/dITP diphosphatase [Clostridium chauvoei]|uniref:dITP/XTP pyrophosphatase n=2 Tax=Clostridium chauvoei TaxID=46867 RepID=S6EMP7_9CLOT|nr:XTP/dITP diphosphatase [Clostridium chauvoei]ATD55978.1 non-canonical purine NTP pyrophosphatase [Clostridium chauvoei]ATD56352.1 non-canonical purine NTP pyrophosphatase, RdgB/HAM1 family [Clostridium chauvoei]MBX7280876.1 XTP/dITP diphosphatase [Clostridium chauvoei]MBX7283359.1 XTP/dITP diphosphatase [Clostridium chauvoei]MBX7285958.1 XTP/dITP diphosphatase [Clostridium chauvoei]